jgi:hypothetical protein
MLTDRIAAYIDPELRPGEIIEIAMVGFRPLSRSLALVAVFPFMLGGLAAATASGWPAWLGGALGGALGALVAAWLDQRQARLDHDGKGLSIGLVVTSERFFVLDLSTGIVGASVEGVALSAERTRIEWVDTEKMQGSGLKRAGVVVHLSDGTSERVIPARTEPFLQALSA